MIRFMFLRDKKSQPIGCLAMKLTPNYITYGLSVLNPLDKFDRTLARKIAQGRLNTLHTTPGGVYGCVVRGSITTMHEVSRTVMRSISTDILAPTRARKAARLWLTNNTTR